MKQLLSVEVTKLIDINLESSNSVILIKGQLETYGCVFACHSDLENCWFLVNGTGMLGVWNGPPQLRIMLHAMPIIPLLRNTESYL